jgi:hypothetical protein
MIADAEPVVDVEREAADTFNFDRSSFKPARQARGGAKVMSVSVTNTVDAAAHNVRRSAPPGVEQVVVADLTHEHFPQWDDLVSRSPHGTVFHYSWWLEATGGEFKILGYWDKHGKLVGGIPLPFKRKRGFVLYHSPLLTPYLGPIFDLAATDDTADRLYIMRSRGEQLAQAIRGFDSLSYIAGASGPDLQGFLWAGFHADLTYTFRLEAGTTVDQAFQKVKRTHRQKLKKQPEYSVEAGGNVSALSALSNQPFQRQGIARPFTDQYLRCLCEAALKRGRAIVYTARVPDGRPVAALLVVNDDRTSYQIVSGVDMSLPDCPAGAVLTWRAICDTLNAGRTFDFEGSRIRGVEEYYRRWGGQAYPVWQLNKTGSLRGLLAKLVLSGFRRRY